MKRAMAAAALTVLALASGAAAQQSVNIPGLGRIRIPTIGRPGPRPSEHGPFVPRSSGGGRNLVVSAAPTQGPDGVWRCATSGDVGVAANVRIVSARQIDQPVSHSIGVVFAQSTGGGQFWQVEFEITNHVPRTVAIGGDGTAIDAIGRRWGGGMASDQRNLVAPGETARRTAVFATGDPGAFPEQLQLTLRLSLAAQTPANGNPYQFALPVTVPATYVFQLPGNCFDEPDPTSAPPAAAGPRLILPHQVTAPGVARLRAAAGSVREAVQAGFIWSYGEGVIADFDQGLAWYREAQRRQATRRDYSMQRSIADMLQLYAQQDRLALLTDGLRALARNGWQESLFFFGRAAQFGDTQGMAALGYVYGEHWQNVGLERYWCRHAFLSARRTRDRHELDAVNHFCPLNAFAALMTPAERAANPASIARARAESADLERAHEARLEQLRRLWNQMVANSGGGVADPDNVDDEIARGRHFSHGDVEQPPVVLTAGLHGNCHGGALMGCPD